MLHLHSVIVLLLWAGAASAQQAPERILERAIALHQAGDAEQAIAEYRAYLKLRPAAVEARSNLGAALAGTGRFAEAIAEYREALKRRPRDPRIRLNIALAEYKLGRISAAAAEFAMLHNEQPADRQLVLLLADCWLRGGDNPRVIELLAPLDATGDPDLAIAYLLGTALLRDRQVDRAQPVIDRILRVGDSAESRLLMGIAKLEALDFAGATADLEKAAALNPRLPDVRAALGTAHIQTGDTAAARAAFEQELELNPTDFESNLQLGALLRQDQDYEGARKLLERALRVRPGDARARFQLASTHAGAGRLAAARAEFEGMLRESPNFVEAHIALAAVYYRLRRRADGDREKALAQRLTLEQRARQYEGRSK